MTFVNADCFDWLPTLQRKARLVILDLPYGMTRNSWDRSPVSLAKLWACLERVTDNDACVLAFGAQPFTSTLVASNAKHFRYCWVWEKTLAVGHLNSKRRPLAAHEDVAVFYRKQPTYNPQMWDCGVRKTVKDRPIGQSPNYGKQSGQRNYDTTLRYPRSVLRFASDKQREPLHPTQKPVDLCRYFVRTYTNPGDLVIDPTAGVASSGVAALLEGRDFAGCELDPEYHARGVIRLEAVC